VFRPLFASLGRCLSLLLLLLLVRPAWAGANDAAAKRALSEAMDEYAKAKDADKTDGALLEAISVCGNDCSPSLLARAWMYIGLVRGNGAKDWETAREAFSVALGFDDKLELDPRFFSPTAQALFDGIKGQRKADDPGKVVPRFEAGTQMGCWPLVQEVETYRPIPIACSTRVQGVSSVVLRYRAYGSDNWTRVDLKQNGDEWRGMIPCAELARPGTWGMYIEAKDERDNPLERLGSRDRPLVFKVVEKSSEPPPSLPGEAAPDRCVATTYCPEEMVGTPACDALQGGAAAAQKATSCKVSPDCDLGMECVDGACKAPGVCTKDADCDTGMMCSAGLCVDRPGGGKRDWFGFHFGADFASLGESKDVCRTGAQEFACFADGQTYDGTPFPQNGGTVTGGLHVGTLRALLSYDRFLTDQISLGVRFGFAFSGAPEDFLPLHFEGRGTYYFGDVVRGRSFLVPYIAVGAGFAQVDSRVEVEMVDCRADPMTGTNGVPATYDRCLGSMQVNQGLLDPANGAADLRTLQAYKSLGKVFGTISPGLMVQLSKQISGVVNLGVLLMTDEQSSTSLILNLEPSAGVILGF
jgi:hypothetical protein